MQGTATQRTRAPRGTAAPVKRNPETAAIREWAKANGHKVSDRGRIHQDVQDAYYEVNEGSGLKALSIHAVGGFGALGL